MELALNVYKLTNEEKLSRDFAMKDQMRRSGISVPSNIAEGDELETDKQSIRHFYIAKGSLAELATQLSLSNKLNYINDKIYKELDSECGEISAMLQNLIKYRSNK